MTRCRTKKVMDNVFDFVFDPHETELRNITKAAATIEGRGRKITYLRRKSLEQSITSISMPSWRAHQSGMTTYKRADVSKFQMPSITGLRLGSTSTATSKIPRSPSPRQMKTSNAQKPHESASPPHLASSLTSLRSSGDPLQTRKVPKNRMADSTKATSRQEGSNNHPHYITVHVGEPCTLGALDHILTCGHKVITTQPGNCASNCNQLHSPHVNPRSIDEPFVCMACITQQIKGEHAEKVSSFVAALKSVADATGKTDSAKWIADKVRIMEIAWRDLELDQMKTQAAAGRFCHAFYIEEDYADLVSDVLAGGRARTRETETRSAALMDPKVTEAERKKKMPTSSTRIPRRSPSPPVTAPSIMSSKTASRLPVPLKSP